ncbi:MAG: tyrosine-type recombinase/integrase [Pseudomonadota bacterium]
MTFGAARAKFLEDSQTRTRPRTAGEYTRLLNKHFSFGKNLSELSRQDIAEVIDGLKDRPSEQKHAYVAVRTMLNWCVKRGYLDVSPVPPMTFKSKPRERVLSDEELAAVWHRAEGFGYPYGRIVQLLILTGQRKGEIVGLRRSWIENGRIVYPSAFVKNERTHTIPLGSQAIELIEAQSGETDLLFPSRFDEEKPFNGFSKCKKAFDQEVEIQPYTLHDLRRTFAARFLVIRSRCET